MLLRRLRRFTAIALEGAVLMAVVLGQAAPASAASSQLRLSFQTDGAVGSRLGAGATIDDSSGRGNNGSVGSAYTGAVTLVANGGGTAADFPGTCAGEPCPNALVNVADHPSLDPGTAAFEWGARIMLRQNETDDGENIIQKGVWGQAGGQWKLQVDKAAGRPSCVVSGTVPATGKDVRVVLTSPVGVADGAWHQVTCRRTADGVAIVIDGAVRASTSMAVVRLSSSANVTIGAKSVKPNDNDQFHGVLDDVFMSLL